jgi:hypothetical protein
VPRRSGLTRGDRLRDSRIETLRAMVRRDRAVLSIDLGEDKQVAVLMDHGCRVLGRRVAKAKAHQLGGLLSWVSELAGRHGFVGVGALGAPVRRPRAEEARRRALKPSCC